MSNQTVSFSNLLAKLNQSKSRGTDPALYETIAQLLQQLNTNQKITNNDITVNKTALDGPIVTYDKDANLANSRELIAGTNITFDESIGQELKISASGGGGTTIIPPIPAFIFDTDADEGFPIPGPPGASGSTGSQGIQGIPGISVLAIDGDDGVDGFSIPGLAGATGATGAQGIQGLFGVSILPNDGNDGEDSLIPGPQGIQGANGTPGGASNSFAFFMG